METFKVSQLHSKQRGESVKFSKLRMKFDLMLSLPHRRHSVLSLHTHYTSTYDFVLASICASPCTEGMGVVRLQCADVRGHMLSDVDVHVLTKGGPFKVTVS